MLDFDFIDPDFSGVMIKIHTEIQTGGIGGKRVRNAELHPFITGDLPDRHFPPWEFFECSGLRDGEHADPRGAFFFCFDIERKGKFFPFLEGTAGYGDKNTSQLCRSVFQFQRFFAPVTFLIGDLYRCFIPCPNDFFRENCGFQRGTFRRKKIRSFLC